MPPSQTPEPKAERDAAAKPVLTAVPPAAPAAVAPVRVAAAPDKRPEKPPTAPFSALRPVAPALPAAPKIVPPAKEPAPGAAAPVRDWAPASPSRLKRRHKGLIASFAGLVVAPLVVSTWYLYAVAQDQYASTLGFSVQRESVDSAFSLITGLASFSGSSSPDTDIIYRYIYSQSLVAEIDREIDLRQVWNKPQRDIVFRLGEDQPIEDLLDYWQRMVRVHYDNATRLIEVRVRAFDPEDAKKIAQLIFDKSTVMINQLNEAALQDAVRFSAEELETTRVQLIAARQAMTAFRNKYQLVDPAADAAAQMTLVSALEQSAAQTRIDLQLLLESTSETDPRVAPLKRRIEVIEGQIRAERAKLGGGPTAGDGTVMADIVSEYEKLRVDQEFAEATYQSARGAHEVAISEARRQTRFLAAHILPTSAESSRDPNRPIILITLGFLATMLWSIGALLYYSLRDRR